MTDANILEQAFESQARAMRDFGYPSVTADNISAYYTDWIEGREAKDIVARFSVGTFERKEYQHIFGTPKGGAA